jgi:hypothetical protein
MGDKGNHNDNAVIESFFASLKRKHTKRSKFAIKKQARADVFLTCSITSSPFTTENADADMSVTKVQLGSRYGTQGWTQPSIKLSKTIRLGADVLHYVNNIHASTSRLDRFAWFIGTANDFPE